MSQRTDFEIRSYSRIIAQGEAALARWSPSNPMRASVERQVADARRALSA